MPYGALIDPGCSFILYTEDYPTRTHPLVQWEEQGNGAGVESVAQTGEEEGEEPWKGVAETVMVAQEEKNQGMGWAIAVEPFSRQLANFWHCPPLERVLDDVKRPAGDEAGLGRMETRNEYPRLSVRLHPH